jgi:hypothetical protein
MARAFADEWKSVRETQEYILRTYGVSWTGTWIRTLAHRGHLAYIQPGPGKTARMLIALTSVDARFEPPASGQDSPPPTA